MATGQKHIDVDAWLKSQNVEIVPSHHIDPSMSESYLANKTPAFFYAIDCDNNYAFVPKGYDDYTILEEMGYVPIKLGYENSNGPVLSVNGDLRVYIILKKDNDVDITYHYFLIKMREFLDTYFDEVSISNNDILIDRRKVVGGAMIEIRGVLVVVFQINFVDKEDDIYKVCPYLKKEPGYIDPKVLSPEELKDEMISWIK